LIPRQWWTWSRECKALVDSCSTGLPTGFMAWVWQNRVGLLEEGCLYLQQCKVPVEAPATYRFHWGNVAKLAHLLARWQEAIEDELMALGIRTVMGQFVYAKPLPV
jgi:hypothetical protein